MVACIAASAQSGSPMRESFPDFLEGSRNYVYPPQMLEIRNYIREITKVRHSVKDKDMMIANLACYTPKQTVRQTAEMMVSHDCGEIAIVENVESLKPIGVITDRD